MRALLVRVGADSTVDGGGWNAPVDTETGSFAYVPIPESQPVRSRDERPYALFAAAAAALGVELPRNLRSRNAHLDPDFEYMTYGDRGQRARQLERLAGGDLLVFYAGLRDVRRRRPLVYAMIGLCVIEEIVLARDVPPERRSENAHTRRQDPDPDEIVVRARRERSGRLARCIPIGTRRDAAYRVHREILDAWGGISSRDGWIGRSARLPQVGDAHRFLEWLDTHDPKLIARNN